jgi:hypothetical protein
MSESGLRRARKHWRYRRSLSRNSRANTSEISSRGIALTDADLASVIGGTQKPTCAIAQTEVGATQPLGQLLPRFNFQNANY